MVRRPTEDDINERKEIWQWIRWWKDKFGLTSEELAYRARYSQDLIERGIRDEPVPIRHALCNFVNAFGLRNNRIRFFEETVDNLSDEECKKLLKPPSPMYPSQKTLWDD